MATNFNRSKYQDTFEKRFGKGSYDSGLATARDIGYTKARAELEKAAYNERVRAFEAEMKEQKSAREKAAKEAKKKKEDTSVIDELVKNKKESNSNEPDKDKLDSILGFLRVDKNKHAKKDDGNFFLDLVNAGKRAVKAANPFDDVGFGDAMMKSAMEFDKEKSKQFDSVDRFAGRATNSASMGIMGNLDKRMRNGELPDYLTKRKLGEGGGVDMLADLTGYLVPGAALAKGLKGTKLGANTAKDILSKPLTKETAKKLAKETSKEGAAVGAIMSAIEIGGREALNPNDTNWKQNLAQFGIETGAGAVLDPLATLGLSKLASKVKKPELSPAAKKIFVDSVKKSEPKSDIPFSINPNRPSHAELMDAYNGKDVKNTSSRDLPFNKSETISSNKNVATPPDGPSFKADMGELTKGVDVSELKDIKPLKKYTNDVYRNFNEVFGKDSPITARVLGDLDASKKSYVDMQEQLLKELDEKIVKGMGIKKGSKLSRLVQDYGEKVIDLPTLQQKAPNDWQKVVEADKWFREKYDNLIDEVNAARAIVYPNNPSKQVPKRDNYYRHFQEFSSWTGLKNIFDTPAAIDPHLVGASDFTKPRTKWAGFMQRRGNGKYSSDAVGGFLNYIPAASYAKNIDLNIPNFRNLKNELADQTNETRNLNEFLNFLDKYSGDLAGKTNPFFDRIVQDIVGRKKMAALTWVNNRVKTNTILGNLSSTLAQVANVPLGIAFAKEQAGKGASRTIKAFMNKNEPIHQSAFLKERYLDSKYRKFDEKWLDQPQKAAEWLMEVADRTGTSFVWNSAYEKGLKLKVANPIKYADENTRRLVAGRGVGEVPLAQKAKVTQLIAPFTLEVGNLWRVMNDMKMEKDFGGLALLFASNFVLNKVMEETRGSSVTFDPIDAALDASEPGLTPLQRAGTMAGEIASNVPLGQFFANLYPEYGKAGPFDGPTREELFGSRNPQRFGTGLVSMEAIQDPLFKLLPPFGGNQIKKTLNGTETLRDEGQFKDGKGTGKSIPLFGDKEELKYPVERNYENLIKSILFGPSATDEAKKYYKNEFRPLSANQTADYETAKSRDVGKEFYDYLMITRREDSVKRKIKEILNDESLSETERTKEVNRVLEELKIKE
ncbi:hypothetical protein [Paenisporosarcina cavernae]|uniref:Large polyvalent protein associated domain-containing protein n=1 Tax=Paenisporosarcina cavernae TaxID=2320858 RepID=A0A385YWW6_9BACL|nr:hypothetical protein [Paenisporosarcina cavernae]AYC30002.1 hypothetical protein D3873_09005 [Paenisporosarcina cavernae]